MEPLIVALGIIIVPVALEFVYSLLFERGKNEV